MHGAKAEFANPVLCRRFLLNANFGTRSFYFCWDFDISAFLRGELVAAARSAAEADKAVVLAPGDLGQ